MDELRKHYSKIEFYFMHLLYPLLISPLKKVFFFLTSLILTYFFIKTWNHVRRDGTKTKRDISREWTSYSSERKEIQEIRKDRYSVDEWQTTTVFFFIFHFFYSSFFLLFIFHFLILFIRYKFMKRTFSLNNESCTLNNILQYNIMLWSYWFSLKFLNVSQYKKRYFVVKYIFISN